MINKDFLKEVFAEEKDLLELKQVKWINVPLFDELSVINIWPMTKGNEQIMKYFPNKMPKGRVPDREYFFNILNTFQPKYVEIIVRHANEQRNSVANEARAKETIEVSDKWWDALNSVPFISRMSPTLKMSTTFISSVNRRKGKNYPFAEAKFQARAATAEAAQGRTHGHVRAVHGSERRKKDGRDRGVSSCT